jgi:hypothetical protein
MTQWQQLRDHLGFGQLDQIDWIALNGNVFTELFDWDLAALQLAIGFQFGFRGVDLDFFKSKTSRG